MDDVPGCSTIEDALHRERDLLAWVTEASPVSLIVIDRGGRIIFANARAEQILGLTRDEITQRAYNAPEWRITDYDGNPFPEEQLPFLQVMRTGQAVRDVRHAIEWPDGRRVLLLIHASPFLNQAGQPDGVVASVEDVTARMQDEAAMRESAGRYSAFVKNFRGIAFRGKMDFTPIFFQGAVEEITGYTEREFILGEPSWDQVIHAEDLSILHTEDGVRLRTIPNHSYEREYRIVRKDGAIRWVHEIIQNVCDNSGNPAVFQGAIYDITERKQAEEILARQAQELARSNAELQQFAHIVSHDLQEPLRTVSNFAGLLAELGEGRLGEEADECIHFVLDGVHRMQEMVQALLEYSRVGTWNREFAPIDCEAVLQRVLTDLGLVIEESGATIIHDPLPTVSGDAIQVGQLLQNLIANAVKFRRPEEPPQVHIGAVLTPTSLLPERGRVQRGGSEKKEGGAAWLFSVRDNGIGIAPRYHEEVFGVFRRLHTREEIPGTGIGLAICARIVERHGGRIWVESEPGQGATFYFTLPMPEEEIQ